MTSAPSAETGLLLEDAGYAVGEKALLSGISAHLTEDADRHRRAQRVGQDHASAADGRAGRADDRARAC